MKKGDTVYYKVSTGTVRASVLTAHKDGTLTVLAKFFQQDGKDVPSYLGFKYRLYQTDLVDA